MYTRDPYEWVAVGRCPRCDSSIDTRPRAWSRHVLRARASTRARRLLADIARVRGVLYPSASRPRDARDAGNGSIARIRERRGRVTRVGARARRDERVRSSTNRFSRDRGERKGERERGDAETDAESRDARRLRKRGERVVSGGDGGRVPEGSEECARVVGGVVETVGCGDERGAGVGDARRDGVGHGARGGGAAAGRADDSRVDASHHVDSGVSNQRSQHRESRSVGARRASDADLSRSQSVWF